jgi:plasmid stability protein
MSLRSGQRYGDAALTSGDEQVPNDDDASRSSDIVGVVVRTIVQLPDEQAAALERAARRRGVSKAAVVREALGQLLAPEERVEGEALRRALAAAGCFASGVPDLAERHDDYLAEQ